MIPLFPTERRLSVTYGQGIHTPWLLTCFSLSSIDIVNHSIHFYILIFLFWRNIIAQGTIDIVSGAGKQGTKTTQEHACILCNKTSDINRALKGIWVIHTALIPCSLITPSFIILKLMKLISVPSDGVHVKYKGVITPHFKRETRAPIMSPHSRAT